MFCVIAIKRKVNQKQNSDNNNNMEKNFYTNFVFLAESRKSSTRFQ